MATTTIKTQSKYTYTQDKGLKTTTDTQTIPKDSFTIREMLIKHANGTLFDNVKAPFYEEQSQFSTIPLNKIQSMDLTDKLQYLQEVTTKANELKTKITEHQLEQQKIIQQKELELQRIATQKQTQQAE